MMAKRAYKIKTDFKGLREQCMMKNPAQDFTLIVSGHASHWENYMNDCTEKDMDDCLECFSAFVFKIPVNTLQQYLGSYLFALLSEKVWKNRSSAEFALK